MPSDRRVTASPLFNRKAKKLKKNEKERLDEEIKGVLEDPEKGEEKKGDLKGILVYKYKFKKEQILLAYEVSDEGIHLLTFGSHENYYRDLKNYLKG